MTTYALLFEGDDPEVLAKACNGQRECRLADGPGFCPFGRNCEDVTAADWEALAIDPNGREERFRTPPPTRENVGEIWWVKTSANSEIEPVLIDEHPARDRPPSGLLIYRRLGTRLCGYVADGGVEWYGMVDIPEPAEEVSHAGQ